MEALWGDGLMYDIVVDDFLATYGGRCVILEMQSIVHAIVNNGVDTSGTMMRCVFSGFAFSVVKILSRFGDVTICTFALLNLEFVILRHVL